ARFAGTLNVLCGLDWNVEGAYQTGHDHNPDIDINSWTAEAEVGLTISKRNKLRFFARGLFAEGPKDDGSDTGYLILYPNRHSNTGFHARYGIADLIPMTNVETVQVGVTIDPWSKWTFGATGLWARTEKNVTSGSSDYGTELDLWGEWREFDRGT